MADRSYLDWNATAPLRPQARQAMLAALALPGNPSSVHAEGRAARVVVEQARHAVAKLAGAAARDVVFTSGGTEANVLALSPGLNGQGRPFTHLLVSAIEHPSVLAGGRFADGTVSRIPVAADGCVDPEVVRTRLGAIAARGERVLVSVMAANNETGVIQPIREIAQMVHEHDGLLHVDAVQAFGKVDVTLALLDADLMTVSAHKIGGPKGVGALVLRPGLQPAALLRGGGQERGMRAGTENVAAIAGFGAAAEACAAAMADDAARIAPLRDAMEHELLAAVPDAVVFGAGRSRLPNTTLVGYAGLKAETAVIALDLAGIAVSSGAACSSGKVQDSHVLAAMNVPRDLARSAVRVSLGPDTTANDTTRFVEAWRSLAGSLSKTRSGLAA